MPAKTSSYIFFIFFFWATTGAAQDFRSSETDRKVPYAPVR